MYSKHPTRQTCSLKDCILKNREKRKAEFNKKRKNDPKFKAYQKEYYAKFRLRNKVYRDEKKKYHEVDEKDIKYYITDECGYIIGYKLINETI